MKEYLITELDIVRGCVIELLLLFISAGALICISPSILNKVFIGGMSCFIISYFLILSILIIYRMVRHLLNMKTANKIFLKVCEQGISLDDSSNVCFLSWQQIERIEIGGKNGKLYVLVHISIYTRIMAPLLFLV